MVFHVEKFQRQLDVSRETIGRLNAYVSLLKKWQQTTNLVAPSTLEDIWHRHVYDSAQLKNVVSNWSSGSWIDLGSGGGFPGMVMAILRPTDSVPIRLVESNRRKALFLREAIRSSGANAIVHNKRIEALGLERADIISARACAPLVQLLNWSAPLLAVGGQCIFHKGQDVDDELTLAHKYWNMSLEILPSQTHKHGKILLIGDLKRV